MKISLQKRRQNVGVSNSSLLNSFTVLGYTLITMTLMFIQPLVAGMSSNGCQLLIIGLPGNQDVKF